MKKLCAKQNRRARQWEFSQTVRNVLRISQCEKPANFAMRNFAMRNSTANFAMRKTISQCEIPFGNAKNHLAMRKTICEFRNAKFRNAKTTLRCEFGCEVGKPHFAMPNGCQLIANCLRKFMFCFFSSDFQYMLQNLHKTSKIKARKIA